MHPFNQYLRSISLKRDEVPSFEKYPFSIPAIRNLKHIDLHPKVTYIIGENGTGKSTLLEAMAVAFGLNPEGGSRNFRFSTFDSHSDLFRHLILTKGLRRPDDAFFLRAESFFNVATEIEKLDREPAFSPPIIHSFGGVPLHEQSHGESFWALMLNRLGGHGLYFFDEPEAALSPTRQMAAIRVIHDLVQADSQFVIATHSPIVMAYPESTIYELTEDSIHEVKYQETEHFQITRAFLSSPESALKELLEDGDSKVSP